MASWDGKIKRIAASGAEIDALRKDIAKTLAMVSGSEAMLEQYAALQMVEDAIKAMDSFIADMRTFSDRLRKSVDFTKAVPTS